MSPTRAVGSTRAAALVVAAAAVLAVAAGAVTATTGVAEPLVALCFVGFIAVGEIVRITLPGDRETAPLAAAGALAYAMLPAFPEGPMTYGVPQVVAVVAAGSVLGFLPHAVAGRSVRLDDLARRVLVAAVVAAVLRPLLDVLGTTPTPALALVMMLAALLGSVVDTALAAAVRASRDRAPFLRSFLDEARAIVGIGSAITATGVLIAIAAGSMGAMALVVFSVPLVLTQFSFRRYAAIRATYLQTIRSLSRVTDVGGYTASGHAQRVSRLSVAVGRELGMSEAALLELEYAALMHDIGQLSLQDPIPGGATSARPIEDQRRIAELGAAVIEQAGVMGDVAVVVERAAEPYADHDGVPTADLPLGSRIIRAANAYDDFVGASPEPARAARGLERLRLAAGTDVDPRVVEALGPVVASALPGVRAGV